MYIGRNLLLLFHLCIINYSVPSQLVLKSFLLKSTRSHFGQFVLIDLVNLYSFVKWYSLFCQFAFILVNSSSFWSTRTHGFGQFVLILGPLFLDICIVEC